MQFQKWRMKLRLGSLVESAERQVGEGLRGDLVLLRERERGEGSPSGLVRQEESWEELGQSGGIREGPQVSTPLPQVKICLEGGCNITLDSPLF